MRKMTLTIYHLIIPFLVLFWSQNMNAQANCSLTCNDSVNSSFDNECKVPLTKDMFLEDGDNPTTCSPNGVHDFRVQAFNHKGELVASSDDPTDNYLTCEDLIANLYEPFQIKVEHLPTGNSCWSYLILEDKLPPTLDIKDVELWCNEPFNPDYIEWTKGEGFGYPRAFDNCDELRLIVNGSMRAGDDNKNGRDCQEISLEYDDEVEDVECHPDGSVSARVIRTWKACDYSGNCTTGKQTITLKRLSINDLHFPPNYDDWDKPALRPNKENGCEVNTMPGLVYDGASHKGFPGRFGEGGTSQEPTGAPMKHGIPVSKIGDKDGYSYPWDDFGFCEINVDWHDKIIDVCVGSYKIIRTWTVVDWCTGKIVRKDQIIKVVDEETQIDAGEDQVISTNFNPYKCEADFTPNPAEIWEACGEVRLVTMKIEGYRQKGHPHPVWAVEKYTIAADIEGTIEGSNTGDPVIVTFPPTTLSGPECGKDLDVPAKYTITYYTLDHCGNTDEDSYEVEVVDETAPTPICDEITQTTVGRNCSATIPAKVFDDGSFDNCGPVSFSVRRMDSEDPSFHPYVEFGPEDVWKNVEGETCMVVLRVTDCYENYQDCMVEVIVDDKIGAVTEVEDRTITCAELDFNGDIPEDIIASLATASDNCGEAELEIVDIRDWRNDCNVGFVEYDFRSVDVHGLPSPIVTATVTVVDDTPIEVEFPDNYTAFCTEDSGGFQGSLDPDVTGRPEITGDDCELVGVSYDDVYQFEVSDDACFKIIRKWVIIDWCAFDEEHPSEPQVFEAYQVIKVIDEVPPVIEVEADRDVCIDATDDCNTTVDIAAPTITDCSSEVEVSASWVYTADPAYCGKDNSGTVGDASNGFTSPSLEPGVLEVTFFADDGCNNVSRATVTYTIIDCKLPTPYCRDLFTVLMPSTGEIAVWASDLDIGSFDNCDDCTDSLLVFAFDEAGEDLSRTFTCDDIGAQSVQMYVIDNAGNADFCEVTIEIQNNGADCFAAPDAPSRNTARVRSATSSSEFKLLQNTPNPFGDETIIGFQLPQAGVATLRIFDAQGRVLQIITNDYAKGFNQILLNASDIGAIGILYYQLEAADNIITKKMILVE